MKRLIIACLLISTICFVKPVGASLISKDFLVEGDGLLTADTDTGLEFLDLTYFQDMTVADISTSISEISYTDPYHVYNITNPELRGFRWASSADVLSLLSSANLGGFVLDPITYSHVLTGPLDGVGVYDDYHNLVNLLGDTNQSNQSSDYQISIGYFHDLIPGSGYHYGQLYILDDISMGRDYNMTNVEISYNLYSVPGANEQIFDYGIFLVRDTEPSAPVPEPATMLLLGSGLIGLAGLGRKRFFKK